MSWLMRSATEVLDLAGDRRALEAFAFLAKRLASDRGGIAGSSDPLSLLTGLAKGDQRTDTLVATILREAASEVAGDEVLADLRSIVDTMKGRLPDLRLLTCRWDDLGTAACADKARTIHWRGLDRVQTPSISSIDKVTFRVAGMLDRGLLLEPNPEIPAGLVASDAGTVRLGLQGKVESKADATFPIQFGSIGLSAESEGAANIDWFVARDRDPFVANSLAAAVGALRSPFDLAALSAAFANDGLLGVSVVAGGGFGVGGSLSIGVTNQLFGRTGATLGVGLKFHSSRRGEFRLSVRPAGTESDDPNAVRVDIRRARAAEDVTGVIVGLTFDLSPLLVELRPTLLEESRNAGTLLSKLQKYIPPSEAIKSELGRQVENRFAAPDLRNLLGAALGSSPEASDLDRLRQRIEGAINAHADFWQADISTLAGGIAAEAIDGLPLPEGDRALITGISTGIVQQTVEALREDLQRELNRTIARGGFDVLESALKEAGERVDSGLSRLDALTAPVTRQLDRFQGVMARVTEALQHSGEVKLGARWRNEVRRSRGSEVQQSLLFHPDRPRAAKLYEQALTGSLEELFADLARGGSEGSRTAPVTLLSGTLQEFANVRKSSGVELTLLDFALGSQGLLDAEVVIETDTAGNIRVCTRAESHWSKWRPGERSEFEAVNVFELASAQKTRRMSLSLSLSQIHEDLREGEAREFFDGLADRRIGLLATDQVQAAMAALRQVAPGTGGHSGELRAWLELDQAALRQLLRIPNPNGGLAANPFTNRDRSEIYQTAIGAMVAGLRTTGSRTDYRNIAHYLSSNGHGEDPAAILTEMGSPSKRHKFRPHDSDATLFGSGDEEYKRLLRIAERADGLITAIEEMRKIYFAEPGSGWKIKDYQKSQETIDEAIVFWIRGEPIDRGWRALLFGEDSIGPYMLSFFKVIADLARDQAGTGTSSPLLASIVVPHVGREQEIMLVTEREPALPDALPPAPAASRPPPLTFTPTAPRPEPSPAPLTFKNSEHQRSHDMQQFVFPLEKKISTYHHGGKRWRAGRSNGRLHAGCDLIAPHNTRIFAMADGEVVKGPYSFYSGTYALEVVHDEVAGPDGKPRKILVRYGEINQMVPRGIKRGAFVKQGDLIATVGRLNSGSSMLHLEMYSNGSSRDKLTVVGINKFKRRKDVMDPTADLDLAPPLSSLKGSGAADAGTAAADREKPKPETWAGKVDPLKVTSQVNVRSVPKIVPGEAAKFRLGPNAEVEILKDVRGGAYPFGQGDLWFEIRHGRQTGYVAAYFIDTDYPTAGATGLGKDAEFGYISRLEGGLNIRSEPSTDASIRYKLDKGTRVKVLSQHTGGVYNSNRNNWLRILPDQQDRAEPGYAAAYYVDIGVRDEPHGTEATLSDDLNEWDRVLLETDWAGASAQTASGQLGHGTPGGVAASERMAKQDLPRVKQVAGRLADVAAKFGVPAALLAGIASRESRCGNALVNGWGDNNNGFGIMQVDRNAHRIRGSSDAYGIEHIEQATGIFSSNLEKMVKRNNGWESKYLLQGATAAYNFGLGNVQTKTKIDIGTTGNDYGSDVLARAKYYYRHPDLHLLRT